ncbi:hypothetical protein B566_EDAN015088 [Ephemera danica]|nr:hypothetical protein B566_EDAN015088 [Ephemera danica]
MNMIVASIREMAPAWSSLINIARKTCEPLIRAPDADALMQHPLGHMCQELPTKMLRCIKRTLAINCPSPIRLGRNCVEVMDELKTCDIFAL